MFKLEFHGNCHGCGNCVVACPVNAYYNLGVKEGRGPNGDKVTIKLENGAPQFINPDLCNGCGVCIEACPFNALSIAIRRRYSDIGTIILGESIVPKIKIKEVLEKRKVVVEDIEEIRKRKESIEEVIKGLRTFKVKFLIETEKLEKAKKALTQAKKAKTKRQKK
jgi:4Fe-4S ferredoxin